MSSNSDGKRRVLGRIKEKNANISSTPQKENLWKQKFRDTTKELEKIFEDEENEETLSITWDTENKDISLDLCKQKIIEIRDKLLSEKFRILMKKALVDANKEYLSDLSAVYEIVKSVYDTNSGVNPDDIEKAMEKVNFPEDSEKDRENYVKDSIYDVPPPTEKALPDCFLDLNVNDYQETMEVVNTIHEENGENESLIEFEAPTDENISSNYNENIIPLYTNWLRLLSNEVENLQNEEESLDRVLGELDTSISHISDLIHVGMIDFGMIAPSNPTE